VHYTRRVARFPSTQWSLIRRSGDSASARHAAFGELATAYRSAIVAYFRARIGAQEAEDATQSFLASSFEHGWWARADADAGSFRGFLLMLMRRHLGRLVNPDPSRATAEAGIDAIADQAPSAARQFDTRFALVLTAQALEALRARYRERGREGLCEQLIPLLGSPPAHGQLREIAASLGMPPNTLTTELKRLRLRLREHLRDQLRDLCLDDAAFESEWTALQQVLGGPD